MSAPKLRYPKRMSEKFWATHGLAIVNYDADTGIFTYRTDPPMDLFRDARTRNIWLDRRAGKRAGSVTRGYLRASFGYHEILLHRFALYLLNGEWPDICDHLNGDRSDNRAVNLRAVDAATNLRNSGMRCDNTSGVTGVSFDNKKKLWAAAINLDRRKHHLGYYSTCDEAAAVRMNAQTAMGFGPRHGAAR